jgi:hypothetical protein
MTKGKDIKTQKKEISVNFPLFFLQNFTLFG